MNHVVLVKIFFKIIGLRQNVFFADKLYFYFLKPFLKNPKIKIKEKIDCQNNFFRHSGFTGFFIATGKFFVRVRSDNINSFQEKKLVRQFLAAIK